jgi:Fic family protein
VRSYAAALKTGFELVMENRLLASNQIIAIQEVLEKNRAGIRKLPGTELKNQQTGETVYIPPQNLDEINRLLANLDLFINDDDYCSADPLVKMALIHYQFESIHPFYDGNGRTGRIINVLYLTLKSLLNIPVLYLSRHIVETKNDYYRLLQKVRTDGAWEEWILYMLDGVEKTAQKTIENVQEIRTLMMRYKHGIRDKYKFYSHELLNSLFWHPYTKIEFIERDIGVTRKTASKYLDDLATGGFLAKKKIGVSNYYINESLCAIFTHKHDWYE